MEQKLNITEILKNKPRGTKLYSMIHGKCSFEVVTDEIFKINFCTSKFGLTQSGECTLIKFGNMYDGGECIIFPSKEMRDWKKFSWKKGDVLISREGSKILFDKWANEDYTKFLGKIKVLGNSHCYDTANYSLASKEEALEFIKSVEEINNGKLNRETLEIEKSEFKDGDILSCDEDTYTKHTTLILHKNGCVVESLVSLIRHHDLVESREPINEVLLSRLYHAREDEKKELFSALAKEGKAWDAKKKQIVDLKSKFKLKPFDKVIVRCSKADKWSIDFFSYKVSNGYVCTGDARFGYCLPYNEETAHLLGTIDEWKGSDHD